MTSLSEMAKAVHENAVAKGWWDGGDRNIGEVLALIHSEVSEALEDWRDGKMRTEYLEEEKPTGFPSELADIIIRTLDLAEALGIDIEKEMLVKMEYNKTRPYRHGGKIA